MKVKYITFFSIYMWVVFSGAFMYWQFTDSDSWTGPVLYAFIIACHYVYYRYCLSKVKQLCCCGHSKEAHGASLVSWEEAQERSRKGDTRYVTYHDNCQCLTYVPSVRWMNERKIA